MTLYKNGAFQAVDDWLRLDATQPLPPEGHVILTADQWQKHQSEQPASNMPLGLLLRPGTLLEKLAIPFTRFSLIVLEFPKYTDGRAYSMARQLRDDYRFEGELRATGDVLFDQIQLMVRSGFDAFEISDASTIKLLEGGQSSPMTHFYQPALGAEAPAGTRPWIRRAGS